MRAEEVRLLPSFFRLSLRFLLYSLPPSLPPSVCLFDTCAYQRLTFNGVKIPKWGTTVWKSVVLIDIRHQGRCTVLDFSCSFFLFVIADI